MATYTVDKISYGGNIYNLQDAGALQLTGGSVTGPVTFGDSVSVDDLSVGTLSTTGNATFANNIQANKINNVTVGSSPKFTDTITTVSTSGSGNAITSITASNGAITATKGSTFLTSSDVSGKIDTAGTGLSKSGTTLNHSNSVTAQTTQAIYPIKIDAQGHISAYGSAVTIPSITLNGSSSTSPSFYAPTGAGTNGYYLKSKGSGAPTWSALPTIPSITLNGVSSTSPSFYAPTGAGTSGQYLKSSGTGAPTWSAFPTIPSAGTSASAVGTTASGGSASTYSKSDHVHNITSSTITSALGYTPYNSTNPNGYTSNVGTVTGVKVNGTTVNPTSGVVDIGTVATSDTKVTQNVISSNDTNSYPLLLSASTNGATATTETALKCSSLTFIRDDDGANALTIGGGRVVLGRVHFNSNETTRSEGTGIGIGTGDSSDSEMFYRTAGSGQFVMQHYTAAKNADGSIPSGAYRNSIITMSTDANNPTLYLYNKSSADTITSYSRLNASALYINDGSAHTLNATGIDKVSALGTSTTICKTQHYTKAMTGNTWYTFDSFTLAAGTWIVQCTATFNSTSSTGARIIRLTTGNTSTTRVNWSCEATLGAHANSMNTVTFTTILTPTASTTYYLRAWSSLDVSEHATNNSGYVTYTRLI